VGSRASAAVVVAAAAAHRSASIAVKVAILVANVASPSARLVTHAARRVISPVTVPILLPRPQPNESLFNDLLAVSVCK